MPSFRCARMRVRKQCKNEKCAGQVCVEMVKRVAKSALLCIRGANDDIQPTVDDMQPTVDDMQPTVDDMQPTVDDMQPTVDDIQPTVDDMQCGALMIYIRGRMMRYRYAD